MRQLPWPVIGQHPTRSTHEYGVSTVKRSIMYAVVAAALAWVPAHADTWAVKRRLLRVRSKAGSFHPVVTRLRSRMVVRGKRKKTFLSVVDEASSARWLKADGIVVSSADGGEEVLPFTSEKDGAKRTHGEGWVPRLAVRRVATTTEAEVVARLDANDVAAMRLRVLSAIRGLDDEVGKIMKDRQLDKGLSAFIAKPKFTPEQFEAFCDGRAIDDAATEIVMEGEDDLLIVDPEIHEELGRLAATAMAQELGHNVLTDPGLNRYVNLVAAVVGQFSSRYDLLYRVVIVDDASVNSDERSRP